MQLQALHSRHVYMPLLWRDTLALEEYLSRNYEAGYTHLVWSPCCCSSKGNCCCCWLCCSAFACCLVLALLLLLLLLLLLGLLQWLNIVVGTCKRLKHSISAVQLQQSVGRGYRSAHSTGQAEQAGAHLLGS